MKVAPDRLAQLLRAFVEEKIRESGINFKESAPRRISSFTAELNDRYKFDPPLKEAEVAELYIVSAGQVMLKYLTGIAEKFSLKLDDIDDKIEASNVPGA